MTLYIVYNNDLKKTFLVDLTAEVYFFIFYNIYRLLTVSINSAFIFSRVLLSIFHLFFSLFISIKNRTTDREDTLPASQLTS